MGTKMSKERRAAIEAMFRSLEYDTVDAGWAIADLLAENERLRKFITEDVMEDEDCGCDFCVKARKIVGGDDGN